MKYLMSFLLLVSFLNIGYAQNEDSFFSQADVFFNTYVRNGLVHYKSLSESPVKLDELISQIESMEISTMDDNTFKAFAINAYNIAVIKNLVDAYPTTSPMKVDGFFTKDVISIGGVEYSLNTLEKKNIFVRYNDARLHFALVCGAMGCPKLLSSAYRSTRLDQQLDASVAASMDNKSVVNYDSRTKKIRVSKIFDWYEKDFGGKKGVRTFIDNYSSTKIDPSYKMSYLPYSWKINEDNEAFANSNMIIKTSEKPKDVNEKDDSDFFEDEVIEDNERYSASALYSKGEFEAKLFTGVYAQKNLDGFDEFNSRSTYLSSFIQTLYGVNSRVNIGIDAWIRSNIPRDDIDNSFLKSLAFKTDEQDYIIKENGDSLRYNPGGGFAPYTSFAGLTHIAPKVKVSPFKNLGDFSIQETLYFPVNKDYGQTYISVTDFFYAKSIMDNMQLFLQLSYWADFTKNDLTNKTDINLNQYFKVFYSYFPTDKVTLYATGSIPYTFKNDRNDGGVGFYEVGLGGKYLLTERFEIELLYTNFILPNSTSKANTFNVGFRYSIEK